MKHNKKKIIRFEECWFRDENFKELVVKAWENQETNLNRKITGCVEDLARWEDDRFGEVPKKIRSIQKKLEDLNRKSTLEDVVTEIRRQEARLDDLLESEEMWWAQHSRASWLRHCDQNFSTKRLAKGNIEIGWILFVMSMENVSRMKMILLGSSLIFFKLFS